ncbi:hypothetical protein F5Y13DRAFT_153969 [Hypoxylon sp. FL1857]|nr:hypothetical protein F5Y13DRAFT_153969 [Hypoxylon sp. FL1857]
MKAITFLLSTISLASSTLALREAVVVIEGPKGNTTLDIPVDQNYQIPDVLNAVSSIYLVGSKEVGLDTINCIPYLASVGQGPYYAVVRSTEPAYFDQTHGVGSIICRTTEL